MKKGVQKKRSIISYQNLPQEAIDLFDEKYVVSTIKHGKWTHDDYIYKYF